MTLLLAGDIGGTKTILRLVEQPAVGSMYNLDEATYPSQDFPDLVPIVQKFLAAASAHLGYLPQPEKACFAIAGPIVNNSVKLTNLVWFLDAERLQQELGIAKISLINDFVAVGYGILGLTESDLHTLQVGKFQANSPIAVIGAGTGLGQAFLTPSGDSYQVFATEGGHTDFAPRTELEFQMMKYLLEKHRVDRISVERVVSGMGIVSIYQFLRDKKIASESPEIGEIIRICEQEAGNTEKTVDPGAVIGKAALTKTDPLSEETLRIFVELYGAEAGNMALKLLPYSGLYVAGGIAAKILPLIEAGGFMEGFINKGRMRNLLEKVPVHVVLNPQVGLIGAAICANRL
ncbi:glucokinase [Phormidium sp. LEGE 05292]|uniref:glucokinase n=1 Tax=[Phormidium] sp. LEGE 05292 TaxID=767427 RepID=UPI0018810EEA|nr:glucokinase [Phormidium sp. LEGE 05292]MBE9226499.1 glucokinase [Phormidium sp. LEGE 05292]